MNKKVTKKISVFPEEEWIFQSGHSTPVWQFNEDPTGEHFS
jgi:hypothetical protein